MSGLVHLVDRSVLRVAGQGTAKFLQGLCTQDMSKMQEHTFSPAAFLSAKGRVLCDTIVLPTSSDEFLIDCHSAVSKSLLRFLIRHKLREPFKVEDVSKTHAVLAALPPSALPASSSSSQAAPEIPSGFLADPRYAAMGHRAVLEREAAMKLCSDAALDLSAYHMWRMCCAVPEGPIDFPVNVALPLYGNLDLLNFISFKKGCYIGQELTMRTKHVGAVRRRMFSVFSTKGEPQEVLNSLKLDPSMPLPLAALQASAGSNLPSFATAELAAENEAARSIKGEGDKGKQIGVLHSVVNNVGLCLLRCSRQMNWAKDFKDELPLDSGTMLFSEDLALAVRAPPYALHADQADSPP